MKPVDGYFLIKPEDLHWRPSNMMKVPNADFLERTKSEILGARFGGFHPTAPMRCASTFGLRNFISSSKAWVAFAWVTKL